MRLFIAEKPSLAQAIASGLGSTSRGSNGAIPIAGGDCVTWCFGHMLENCPPDVYDPKWKSWDMKTLPIVVSDWRLKPRPDVKEQLATISRLLKQASTVVNAGDPDREGQLLIDELLHHFGWHGPTQRLLLNATDKASVAKALASMRDNREFVNLSDAALCRSRADWLVGMNLSRAATLKFGRDREVISIGRVQTPTLGLVVRRDREIENFKPRAFFTLVATVKDAHNTLELEHAPKENRIFDRRVAESTAAALKGKTVDLEIEHKTKRDLAPMPYMLATFQRDAEKTLHVGAKAALQLLQDLYEAQLTSYPRTDHEHLPQEQAAAAVGLARTLIAGGIIKEAASLVSLMRASKRIYSLSKEAEHHGLVPTGKLPSGLDAKHQGAYELVCKRFIMSLLPDYEYEETVVSFVHNGRRFAKAGDVALNADRSWRALQPKKARLLVLNGKPTQGVVQSVRINSGMTEPPERYTEASLIADMRSVAKFVTDPKLKSILKETSGIGTAATQAGIIETLKKRGFVGSGAAKAAAYPGAKPRRARGAHAARAPVAGVTIVSTELGRRVVDKVPRPLSDPGVTAAWEDALGMIAKGSYKPADFMRRTDLYVKDLLGRLLA